jgi:hypothetical protein
VITVVRQRHAGDCGVAAIATLLSARLAYEDVYLAAARIDPAERGRSGLQNQEVVKLARQLGLRLVPARAFDLDVDAGVLRITSETHRRGHWVAVRWGLVLDPADGFLAPWRGWVARYQARLGTLLREVSGGS